MLTAGIYLPAGAPVRRLDLRLCYRLCYVIAGHFSYHAYPSMCFPPFLIFNYIIHAMRVFINKKGQFLQTFFDLITYKK